MAVTTTTTLPAYRAGARSPAPLFRAPFDDDLLDAVAAAKDLRAGLAEAFALLRRHCAVAGIEWWAPAVGAVSLWLEFSAGDATGPRTAIPIGAAGTLVLVGESPADLEPAIARLGPVLHHRWIAEQLADHAARLARKNEALDDFAALVAHDVRSSLLSAGPNDEPRESLTRVLELVDSILEAVRADRADGRVARAADCVQQAVADLGDIRADVITQVTGDLPIPPAALRIVLRNLLANAVAAGAHRIHISALAHGDRQALVVDDDGVGLGSTDHYATGAQLGLALCRRLVTRFGGVLELKPRAVHGTRAVIILTGADE
jgi:signal transduction histidine kinase